MLFTRKYMPRFWTKFLRDAQCAQHADGVIPDVVPAYPLKGRKTGDPAWAGNYPLVVWYVYQYLRRPAAAGRTLPQHEALGGPSHLDRRQDHLIEKGGYYGDHMLPGEAPGKEEFISTGDAPGPALDGLLLSGRLDRGPGGADPRQRGRRRRHTAGWPRQSAPP